MADYSDLKKLAEEVNEAFPDKEDLWNMVCTPSVALHLVADIEQLKAENEALRKALKSAEESMWKSEANMDVEAAEAHEVLKSLREERSHD